MTSRVILLGLVFVLGPALGASLVDDVAQIRDLLADEYDSMLYGVEKNSTVGFSVVVADINADGLDDIITGAPYADGRFRKKIDDAGATYVYFGRRELDKTADFSTEADLTIYGRTKNENSGFALAVGDLNADGIEDIIIGAPLADSRLGKKKQNDSGVTYVVFGRKEFPDAKIGLETGAADVELHSSKNGEYTGSALAIGDYNGDGVADVLIGGPFSDVPKDDAGVAYVVYGSRELTGKVDITQNASAAVRGLNAGDRLGLALAAGDLNADGIDDLVLGALEADSAKGVDNVGRVSVIFGRKDLPEELDLGEHAGFRFSGSYRYDFVGSAMCVGDINGDGVDDLMVGVPYADLTPAEQTLPEEDPAKKSKKGTKKEKKAANAGKVFVFYGGKSFGGERHLKDGADLVLLGAQGGRVHGDFAGGTVEVADLNADGCADMVAAAPLADVQGRTRTDAEQMTDVGAVYVVHGSGELSEELELRSDYAQVIYGAYENDFFGGMGLTKQRAKDTFLGGAFGLAGTLANPDAYRKAWMSKQYDRFFSKSIGAGDVNGDGVADLAVGAPTADGPRSVSRKIDDAGAVYLFLGEK